MGSLKNPNEWRLVTPGGIRYKLLDCDGSIDFSSTQCKESILVKASDVKAFIRESFPLPVMTDGIPQWQARGLPGLTTLLTKRVSWKRFIDGKPIDPFGSDTDDPPEGTYGDVVQIDIEYDDSPIYPGGGGSGNGTDENDPETFLKISGSVAGEFIQQRSDRAYWFNDETGAVALNKLIDLPASRFVSMTEWSVTWPMLNYAFYKHIMVPRLRTVRARVNDATYSLLYNAPRETLLCTGWEADEEHQLLFPEELAEGETPVSPLFLHAPVNLVVKFLEKNGGLGTSKRHTNPSNANELGGEQYIGHNHFWKTDTQEWQRLIPTTNGTLPTTTRGIYEETNFDVLFAPATEEELEALQG